MDLNDALTQFVTALLGLLGVLITYYVVPWIKANTNAKQREMAVAIVHASVGMVEQVAPQWKWDSTQKRDQAERYAKKLMEQYGVELKEDELDLLIESTVNELNTIVEQLTVIEDVTS